MEKTIRRSFIRTWVGEVPEWECMFVHRNEGLFLSVYVDDTKMAGKKQKMVLICKNDEKCHYWRTHINFS